MQNGTGRVDQTLEQGGTWEFCTFEVPFEVPDEAVPQSDYAEKCMHLFGDELEKNGFQVLAMTRAEKDKSPRPVDPDRKRFRLWAWVKRDPVTMTLDIPDQAVPSMLELGMRLN